MQECIHQLQRKNRNLLTALQINNQNERRRMLLKGRCEFSYFLHIKLLSGSQRFPINPDIPQQRKGVSQLHWHVIKHHLWPKTRGQDINCGESAFSSKFQASAKRLSFPANTNKNKQPPGSQEIKACDIRRYEWYKVYVIWSSWVKYAF